MPPLDADDLSNAEDSDSRHYSARNGLTNGGRASAAASAAAANESAGGRSRYLQLKERRARLGRSRSSHNLGNDEDSNDLDDDPPLSPTTASPSAYLASRCAHKGVFNYYDFLVLKIAIEINQTLTKRN